MSINGFNEERDEPKRSFSCGIDQDNQKTYPYGKMPVAYHCLYKISKTPLAER